MFQNSSATPIISSLLTCNNYITLNEILLSQYEIILELSIFLQSENTLNFNTEDLQVYF